MGTLTAPDGTVSGTTQSVLPEPIAGECYPSRRSPRNPYYKIRIGSRFDSDYSRCAKTGKGLRLGAVLAAEYTATHTGFLGMNDLFHF